MEKGNITISINEVWELINKPQRFFRTLHDKVEELEVGEYQYLDFSRVTKHEILQRITMLQVKRKE